MAAEKAQSAADLRSQADQMEAQEKAKAEADARAKETPEEKAARLDSERKEAEDKQLREDPTDEQKATTVGLFVSNDQVQYVEVGKLDAKERRLLLQGQNWEHVSDDAFGRWLYRQM